MADTPEPQPQVQPSGAFQAPVLTGFEEFIKAINLATIQYSLYHSGHPLIKQFADNAYAALTKILSGKHQIPFGMVEDRLLVEDKVLDLANPSIARFFTNFKKLKIDALTFFEGIPFEELNTFLNVFSMKEDSIEAKGGITILLIPEKIPHIKLEKVHYARIGDDEVIVSAEEGLKAGGTKESEGIAPSRADYLAAMKVRKETLYKVFLRFLLGEIEDLSAELDEKKLLQELERNPKRTATQLIDVGRQVNNLSSVMQKLGGWLLDLLEREGDSLRKDLSVLMAEIGKRVQEELLAIGAGSPDNLKTSEALGTIVSQYVEKLKINMIINKFNHAKKKSADALAAIVQKTFESNEERDKIMPALAQRLKQESILKDKDFDQALEKIKDMPIIEKKIEIPIAELRRLMEFEQKLKTQQARQAAVKEVEVKPEEAVVLKEELEALRKKEEAPPAETEKLNLKPDEVVISKKELKDLRNIAQKAEEIINIRVRDATKELLEQNKEMGQDLERANKLLHELSSGVVVVDKEEKVMLMNRAAEDLLGISKENMVGKPILEQLKDEHLLALVRRGSGAGAANVELSSPNSNTKDAIKASTTVVEDENGKTIGMLFVLSDVTKQKELEKTKNDFVGRVSAHLKDPLVTLQDSLILLLGETAGGLSEEQKRLLLQAKESSERLQRSIDAVVSIKEAEQGLQLNLLKFDLVSLIENSLVNFELLAKEKSLSLKKDLPRSILEVSADKEKINLVLANLLSNALKATSRNGLITVRAAPYLDEHKKPTDFVCVSVEDTGKGIPAVDMDKIFGRFAETSTKEEKFSGLGLGLNLAKEIISRHKGRIWAESSWGKGSKFSFILPLDKS